jgi:galactonate dehydratase
MKTASSHRRDRLSGIIAAQVAAAVPDSRLEITEIRLFRVREPVSHRSYSIVRVRTRRGLTGFGEGPPVPDSEFAPIQQYWMGKPATSYTTTGPLLPLSGAVDIALFDIIGKNANAPVYPVLGGPTRNKVRAFTSASLQRATAAGYRAVSVTVPSPAARNQGQAYQRDLRKVLESLRSNSGDQFDFVLDGAGLLTPGDAANVAMTIESMHPLWFDDPVPVANTQTIRKIADESVVPLGFGRGITSATTYQELLRESLIDIVRPDIGREGISGCRRIAAMAEPYYVAIAPRHDGGPIATAAAVHLAASLPNFFIQHIPLPEAEEDVRMRTELVGAPIEQVREGFAGIPTGPGLGINVNQAALEKYHAA